MILEYLRPKTLDEALQLLGRIDPLTVPLGGGTHLSRSSREKVAVVDLQSLGLNTIERQGNQINIGAAVPLQQLYDSPDIQPAMRVAIRQTTNFNLRQTGTVAGALVSAKGNSPFATVMMALDARTVWAPGEQEAGLGDYLALRKNWQGGKLIIQVRIPLQVGLQYEAVARTPADQPILCAAMARWSSGRTRLVIGGQNDAPMLALDGQDASGIIEAAKNACSHFSNNSKYHLDYLKEIGGLLVGRMIANAG